MSDKVEGTSSEAGSSTGFKEDGDDALKLVGIRREHQFTEEYNRRLRRKLDFVIPPILAAVYFIQYLDKATINYASIMGLPIVGENYNSVSLAFYIGYFIWEFPTQYIAQRLPIAKYLGSNIAVWGAVVMLHAVAPQFSAFYFLRFILGMLESCVAPILILVVSMFYKKNEQGLRIAIFYMMLGLAQVFGGFVAYGISFYTGSLGSWRIMFLVLGALGIIVGLAVLIFLPDSPVTARFLTEEERIGALERVRDDQGGTHSKQIKLSQIKETFLDPRSWLIVVIIMLITIPNGALTTFTSLIIRGFGYTSQQSLILSAPGGLVSAVTTLLCGYISDRTGDRMLPVVGALVPGILGAILLVVFQSRDNKSALLAGIYILNAFGAAGSILYAWNASNTSGHTKKVTLNAFTLVAFAIGNMVGTEIMQPQDAPAYIPGKATIITALGVAMIGCICLRAINLHLNKVKRSKIQAMMTENGWTEEDLARDREKSAFLDLTDRENPHFIYTA